MHSVSDSIRARGGLAATFELHDDGHGRRALAAAVASGFVIRVRQGWYALREVAPELRESARVGGPATCVTGLRMHGVWTRPSSNLHVSLAPHACRPRTRTNKQLRLTDAQHPRVRAHWTAAPTTQRLLLAPIECLADLIQCEGIESRIAAADSALHLFPALAPAWRLLAADAPSVALPWLRTIDGVCESGTESVFWFRMSPLGTPFWRQVSIPGVGRVDFLIGTRLVIEVDSLSYHADPLKYEADRRRDARLSALGYRVLRFSYEQVFDRWHEVEAAVLAAVLRGDSN